MQTVIIAYAVAIAADTTAVYRGGAFGAVLLVVLVCAKRDGDCECPLLHTLLRFAGHSPSGPLDGSPRGHRLVSVGRASQLSGMSERWIYQHASSLPWCRRIGRAVRCDEEGLRHWIEGQSAEGSGSRLPLPAQVSKRQR